MGRIRGRTRNHTRAVALQAAASLFAEGGFTGTSLAAIAAEAGVTPATLCHHFGGKRGLHDAVTAHIYQVMQGLLGDLDPTSTFPEIVAQVYSLAEAHRPAIRVLVADVLQRGGLNPTLRAERAVPLSDLVVAHLAARHGCAPSTARHALVVLSHLVIRFVCNTPQDNAIALGSPTPEATRALIIHLLVTTGQHLLSPSLATHPQGSP